MAKLLVTSHGTTGDILPYLRLCKALIAAGHSVTLASTPNHAQRARDWELPFAGIGIPFGPHVLAAMLAENDLGPSSRSKGVGGFARHVLGPYLQSAYPAFLELARDYDAVVA